VTARSERWLRSHARHEAGSPNVVGCVAMGVACDTLKSTGFDAIAAHERALTARLHDELAARPGLRLLQMWPSHEQRLGIASFVVDGLSARLVAAMLADSHAIGVRCGRFCAHPLVDHLLARSGARAPLLVPPGDELPGAVRASVGLGSTHDDLDRLFEALDEVLCEQRDATYCFDRANRRYTRTDGPPQRLPELPFRLRGAEPAFDPATAEPAPDPLDVRWQGGRLVPA
jgi:selenocysteine lyase/cysteine desulfurase